jgi:hypothetical protein
VVRELRDPDATTDPDTNEPAHNSTNDVDAATVTDHRRRVGNKARSDHGYRFSDASATA